MPVPPILEIYVVWHPDDDHIGAIAAERLTEHFHGPAYAGLAGGAVEVYVRSVGWEQPSGSPRPLPFISPLPAGLPAPQFTVVVPVLGTGLARAVEEGGPWRGYLRSVFAADGEVNGIEGDDGGVGLDSRTVGVYPLRDPNAALANSQLAHIAGGLQGLPVDADEEAATLARELAQAIVQRLDRGSTRADQTAGRRLDGRVTVFVSHTKHQSAAETEAGADLVDRVRRVLSTTHLGEFFDAHDIQVGDDWRAVLERELGHGALLMVRTDRYSSREWCQREVHTAKSRDLAVVALYAVRDEDERGSFLMDHVPVIPCRQDDDEPAIERALNRLVDETLKRALWREQTVYLREDGFDWLPGHAPEPVTLVPWLAQHRRENEGDQHVWILHPDPPLGPRENEVIVDLCALAGFTDAVDVLTPRTFASRGGRRNR